MDQPDNDCTIDVPAKNRSGEPRPVLPNVSEPPKISSHEQITNSGPTRVSGPYLNGMTRTSKLSTRGLIPGPPLKAGVFFQLLLGKLQSITPADSHTAGPLWICLTVSAGDGERQTERTAERGGVVFNSRQHVSTSTTGSGRLL